MLTVVIEARNDEERLARTLASLVPAAVEGLVREVIVADAGSTDGTAMVADHAGCRRVRDVAEAVVAARGEWLLLLEPGSRLVEGWSEATAEHLATQRRPARFTNAVPPSLLARLLRRGTALEHGLVIRRAAAAQLASGSAEALARRAGRPLRLEARIRPAGGR